MRERWWAASGGQGPLGLAVGASAVVVATVLAAALFPTDEVPARLIVVAVAAGVCAAVLTEVRVVMVVTGLAYLLAVGFLIDTPGQLTMGWLTSQGYFLVYVLAALVGLGYRRVRMVQADATFDAELRECNAASTGGDDQRPGR